MQSLTCTAAVVAVMFVLMVHEPNPRPGTHPNSAFPIALRIPA